MIQQIKGLAAKKNAILGFGIEGQSLARFFAESNIPFTVLDQKTFDQFTQSEQKLLLNIKSRILGNTYLKNLKDFDIIFRSPGIYRYLAEIVEAENFGVFISSPMQLFFDLSPAKIIGVTGTKGKGTTSTLIYKILVQKYKSVFFGGNIGKPAFDFLKDLTSDSWIVLELSSFQLIDLKKSPHIAVILMITSEHLDWHKDQKEYNFAKESIVRYQNAGDYVIFNQDFQNSKKIGLISIASKFPFSSKSSLDIGAYLKNNKFIVKLDQKEFEILSKNDLQILGEHNWQNVLAAILTGSIVGVEKNKIGNTVREFKGLPHRLEFVKEISKIGFYNDSFSTTPETTIAAINSFAQNLILILGGSSKKSDFASLAEVIANSKNIKSLILIGKTANELENLLVKTNGFKGKIVKGQSNMKKIVMAGFQLAKPGEIVLLSPACASFDMFENYIDRGNQFKKEVLSLAVYAKT